MSLKEKLRQFSKLNGLDDRRIRTNDPLSLARAARASKTEKTEKQKKLTSLRKKLIAGRKDTTPEMSEVKRICSLPIEWGMTEEQIEKFCYDMLLAQAYDEGFRFFDCQANAISDYIKYGGGFFPMGVGWGKTLTTLVIAAHAYKMGIHKILLLVPPNVYAQLVNKDIPWARTKITLALPFIKLGKLTLAKREKLARSGRPGCYIMPYSLLSTEDSVNLLKDIEPGLIVCDEAHKVKNRSASRTQRFINYVHENNPQLVCLSGTITSKGIADYQHLIRLCLGNNCPIPRSPIMASEWGSVIDSGVFAVDSNLSRPLLPLLSWARKNFLDEDFHEITSGFRKAYKKRLVSAPGVVSTGDAEIGTSLVLVNRSISGDEFDGWGTLEELMARVEDLYLTPNGDEIEHAIHSFKWKYELSAGFYNQLVWPEAKNQAEIDRIERAKEHHAAKQDYSRKLRKFLTEEARPGYDTPMLVGRNISLNGSKFVGAELYGLWQRMKTLEFDGMPERISQQVRVCPYKRDAAVKWASCLDRGEGALIWVWHQELGKWIYEGLKEAGIDAKYARAGRSYDDMILNPKNEDKVVVASMAAHGIGKNLQAFHNVLFAQWPRPANDAEQVMGRVHRNGLTLDELQAFTLNSIPFDHEVFAATLNDALYIQQTTGQRQKLIIASYDPMPRIFSPEFLRERGMEPESLDGSMRRVMTDRFGDFT